MSSDSDADAEFHEMRQPTVEKVVVHMGVGTGGRELANAEDLLAEIAGQQPVRTQSKRASQDFGVRQGEPVGAKVTLRGAAAEEFLETALSLTELSATQFDEYGNFSFGVAEHTAFPNQEYDPNIGIYGLDVTVNLVRPGYRVRKRDEASSSIPSCHQLTPEDAVAFVERELGVSVAEVTDE